MPLSRSILHLGAYKSIVVVSVLVGLAALLSIHPAAAAPVNDEFIRGYATALLQRNFQTTVESLEVENGTIFLRGLDATDVVRDRIKSQLSSIQGVRQVVIADSPELQVVGKEPQITPELPAFLPRDLLFSPLLADPRWPHFSASYQRYVDGGQLKNVGSATFGETFSIYRFGGPWESLLEVGIQAGVFSIFDLGADSLDLINADYSIAFPVSFKRDAFSGMLRIFHQSSHLGDEYLLRGDVMNRRVNLSYEGIDTILSYTLPFGFRIYGGGGYLFDRDPSDLDPWLAQSGLEFRSPWTLWGGAMRPVAAVDIQNRQESGWDADVSARAGVQFEDPDFFSRRMQLLVEYYNGSSPNGQFYIRDIEYIGIGLHFFYD